MRLSSFWKARDRGMSDHLAAVSTQTSNSMDFVFTLCVNLTNETNHSAIISCHSQARIIATLNGVLKGPEVA
jgi:hypothetical protein